jgi:hypothetical protein
MLRFFEVTLNSFLPYAESGMKESGPADQSAVPNFEKSTPPVTKQGANYSLLSSNASNICTPVSVARTVHDQCCIPVSVARTVCERGCTHVSVD